MEPIFRGKGVTESERYLAQLADATFLKLWSYPNTYFDRKKHPGEAGKELCDLLVVCGNEIIIFSDKSIAWPQSDSIGLSWNRWYRRAVKKSVDQIRGAERWIREFPDRMYLDPACTRRLPFELPPLSARRVHGIAIALGAQGACSKYYNDDDGSLIIYPVLKGKDHIDDSAEHHRPFALGDVDPDGPFVHVFDETALNLIMREMDTVSDFVRYLNERSQLIRSGRLAMASSEADLLAMFMSTEVGEDHYHRFPTPDDPTTSIFVAPGQYQRFVQSRAYNAKKRADSVSYIWDKLIGEFADNILDGSSVSVLGEEPSAHQAEPALRMMARESRLVRRALGDSFRGALIESERRGIDRFTRLVMPNELFADQTVAYIFMVLAYPSDIELEGGYGQYRQARAKMLETYCYSVLYDHRGLKCAVGIAIDASSRVTKRRGGSEDLIAVEVEEWTDELERGVRESRAHYDVLQSHRLRGYTSHIDEYPQPNMPFPNRQQRRAAERKAKKALRSPQVSHPTRK